MSGNKMKNARALKNKFDRENIHFEMVQPPFTDDFMKELKEISIQWLNGRKEKGFSLGFFDEDYLDRAENRNSERKWESGHWLCQHHACI